MAGIGVPGSLFLQSRVWRRGREVCGPPRRYFVDEPVRRHSGLGNSHVYWVSKLRRKVRNAMESSAPMFQRLSAYVRGIRLPQYLLHADLPTSAWTTAEPGRWRAVSRRTVYFCIALSLPGALHHLLVQQQLPRIAHLLFYHIRGHAPQRLLLSPAIDESQTRLRKRRPPRHLLPIRLLKPFSRILLRRNAHRCLLPSPHLGKPQNLLRKPLKRKNRPSTHSHHPAN